MPSPSTIVPLRQPDAVDDPLTAILRSGARRLLAQGIEAEAEAFLATMKTQRLPDGRGRGRVVRHGHGLNAWCRSGSARSRRRDTTGLLVRRPPVCASGAAAAGRSRPQALILTHVNATPSAPVPRDGR